MDNFFDAQKLPNYYSEEILYKYYNKYLYNLKQFNGTPIWLLPTDSRIKCIDMPEGCWIIKRDKYLRDTCNNHTRLGLDVLKNGTYWPICLVEENNKYKLQDGIHRLASARYLYNQGIWPKNRKLLFIISNKKLNKSDEKGKFYIPNYVTKDFKKQYEWVYNLPYQINQQNLEFRVIKLNKSRSYLFHVMYSLLLRNAFFEYKKINNKIIKPATVINNQNEWNKWFNKS